MNKVVLTFDLDWCSDEILKYTIDKLVINQIPATFFVTHDTPLLNYIREFDFFELGIHPNFRNNSTQGNDEAEIIKNCLSFVPEAKSVRTHGLHISSNLLIRFMKHGLINDNSLFTPNIEPVPFTFEIQPNKIVRVGNNWEDDLNFYIKKKTFSIKEISNIEIGIFCFHPIHVFLNSKDEHSYEKMKSTVTSCKIKDILYLKNKLSGSETMLNDIIDNIKNKTVKAYTLDEFLRR